MEPSVWKLWRTIILLNLQFCLEKRREWTRKERDSGQSSCLQESWKNSWNSQKEGMVVYDPSFLTSSPQSSLILLLVAERVTKKEEALNHGTTLRVSRWNIESKWNINIGSKNNVKTERVYRASTKKRANLIVPQTFYWISNIITMQIGGQIITFWTVF